MIQQINLYLPEFRRKKDPLTLENMGGILALFVLLLALVSGWQYWELMGLRGDLERQNALLSQAEDSTRALMQGMGVQGEDLDLAEQVRLLEQNLAEKRVLANFLEVRNLGNSRGFSEYLADLSRYHVPGLSLTGVELQQGGERVRLSGQVLRAESVPAYLENLRQGQSYLGSHFSSVSIGNPQDNGILEFQVATAEGAP